MSGQRPYYKVLGVKSSATQEEIKRAYRDRVGQAHPDRAGGSHEKTAQLTEAYTVLKDPKRRKRYDETGSDKEEESIEAKAQAAVLLAFIESVTASPNMILESTKRNIATKRAELKELKTRLENAEKIFKKKRGEITTTEKFNSFHKIVDDQLTALQGIYRKIEDDLKLCDAADAILSKYTSSETAPTPTKSAAFSFDLSQFNYGKVDFK